MSEYPKLLEPSLVPAANSFFVLSDHWLESVFAAPRRVRGAPKELKSRDKEFSFTADFESLSKVYSSSKEIVFKSGEAERIECDAFVIAEDASAALAALALRAIFVIVALALASALMSPFVSRFFCE